MRKLLEIMAPIFCALVMFVAILIAACSYGHTLVEIVSGVVGGLAFVGLIVTVPNPLG